MFLTLTFDPLSWKSCTVISRWECLRLSWVLKFVHWLLC